MPVIGWYLLNMTQMNVNIPEEGVRGRKEEYNLFLMSPFISQCPLSLNRLFLDVRGKGPGNSKLYVCFVIS